MMESQASKNDIIKQLQNEVCSLQGYKRTPGNKRMIPGFDAIEAAFPDNTFPTGVVHEFISYSAEDATSTNGFISTILGHLMQQDGHTIWVSTHRTVFPAGLKFFGVAPERVIFIDLQRPKEALWAVEEALKCGALVAVVGELGELTFTESRRLQLAVEHSRVTGFMHRYNPKIENPVACVTRWKIKPISSMLEEGMPGVGFPKWDVQLLKVRNGQPGNWQMEWSGNGFQHINTSFSTQLSHKRKTG
jgi:protein ImuA